MRVLEGVYDPRQGDFAVAGSIDLELGVDERAARLKVSRGSFGTTRVVGLYAPAGHPPDTFAAAAVRTTNGFGPDNVRGGVSGNVLGQYRLELGARTSILLHLGAYGVRSALAGVLRRDDLEARRVTFLSAYPDPTARAQSAGASRAQAAITLERTAEDGGRAAATVWTSASTFRLRQNFTVYAQRSRENPAWVGRGDLIEQSNDDFALGGSVVYRTRRH